MFIYLLLVWGSAQVVLLALNSRIISTEHRAIGDAGIESRSAACNFYFLYILHIYIFNIVLMVSPVHSSKATPITSYLAPSSKNTIVPPF